MLIEGGKQGRKRRPTRTTNKKGEERKQEPENQRTKRFNYAKYQEKKEIK